MGTVNSGLFTSTTDEWPTPQGFFDTLAAEFGFTVDVCASQGNAKCERYFDRAVDGLAQQWTGVAWMNPPYGRGIDRWVRKAYESARVGATVVCLLPARTDTAYWHDYVMRASELRLIRGRLHFTGAHHQGRLAAGQTVAHNAPFPSAVVVFRPGEHTVRTTAIDRTGQLVTYNEVPPDRPRSFLSIDRSKPCP